MDILRRKDIGNYEAGILLRVGDETCVPGRWYGRGCAAAGFTPGSVVRPYYLRPLAALCVGCDVVCAGDPASAAAMAAALEEAGEAPAPDMGDDWVIAAFAHDAWTCPGWLFPHAHNVIIMAAPAEIRRTLRECQEIGAVYGPT